MHKGAQPGRIGRATWPAGTSCLEGVGRQGRGETEHTSGYRCTPRHADDAREGRAGLMVQPRGLDTEGA